MTPSASSTPATAAPVPQRLASLDAYRGFVMFLMMAEVLHLGAVAERLQAGKIALHGWCFKIDTAEMFAYDPGIGQFQPLAT